MRIFVAGATGVLGAGIVPLLVQAGHDVMGLTRSPEKAASLDRIGAAGVVGNVYDADALVRAVVDFAPEVILNELTDLPDTVAELPSRRDANARIRVVGTDNLVRAARAAGCGRLISQSVAWDLPPGAGADGVAHLEEATLGLGGVVLRYGQLYGPGTFYPDAMPAEPRVHIDEAARRTVELLEAPSGIVTIVDDGSEPTPS